MNTLDLTTGLPQLPEGFFFRIKKWNYFYRTEYTVQVMIRRRFLRWFSISTGCDSLADHRATSGWHTIPYAAINALDDFNRRAIPRTPSMDTRKAFIGDYPPKVYKRP